MFSIVQSTISPTFLSTSSAKNSPTWQPERGKVGKAGVPAAFRGIKVNGFTGLEEEKDMRDFKRVDRSGGILDVNIGMRVEPVTHVERE